MASLQLAAKARHAAYINPVPTLYRAIAKELPRVLTIYDIDIPAPEARAGIRSLFQQNAQVKDTRVLDMLVEKGYMELEETLLHHKQRPHLLRIFEGFKHKTTGADRKKLGPNSTIEEQFDRA
jgi:NADH dehydrogenase (ubiquinone) 1 alpha subcomplex subunit 6